MHNNQKSARFNASSGQSLVEYGLIMALVAVVAIGGLQMLGNSLQNQFTQLASAIGQAGSSSAMAGVPAAGGGGTGGSGSVSPPVSGATPSSGGTPTSATAPSAPSGGTSSTDGTFENGCDGGTCNGVAVNPALGW